LTVGGPQGIFDSDNQLHYQDRMYLCLCKAVSMRAARRCVEEGERSVEQVGRRCGAGTSCGACKPDIEALIVRVEQDERVCSQLAAK
jgi:bacterioferritin-associated ferredoxin